MKNLKLTLTLSLLTLGFAATADATAQGQTTTRAAASAAIHVQSAVLLDAQGRIVGTFNQAGRLVATGAAHAAKQVRVTLESGTTVTYDLAANAQANTHTTLSTIIVKSGETRATLGTALNATLRASADAASTARTTLNAKAQLLADKTITLTNAAGQTVGEFDANGTLVALGDLRLAKHVTVTLQNGQQRHFELAGAVNTRAQQTLQVETVNVKNQAQTVTLISLLATLDANGHAKTDGATTGKAQAGSNANTSTGSASNTGGQATTNTSGNTSTATETGVSIGVGVGVGVGIGIGGGK